MKKTLSSLFAGGILAAGTMFAMAVNDITVTLPHAITVGSATLPSGTYTMSPMETSDGSDFFVLRGRNVAPIMLPVQRIDRETALRTAVTLSESGDTWRLETLSIQGDRTAYEFNGK